MWQIHKAESEVSFPTEWKSDMEELLPAYFILDISASYVEKGAEWIKFTPSTAYFVHPDKEGNYCTYNKHKRDEFHPIHDFKMLAIDSVCSVFE